MSCRSLFGFALALLALNCATLAERGNALVLGNSVIHELAPDAEFQGYGFLDDNRVFLAYSGDPVGGAGTIIAVYDVAARKQHVICELGGTGESTFAVNRKRSAVAFNWIGGIYLASFAGGTPPSGCAKWEQGLALLVRCQSCYEVKWRDADTIEYAESVDGKWRTRTVSAESRAADASP